MSKSDDEIWAKQVLNDLKPATGIFIEESELDDIKSYIKYLENRDLAKENRKLQAKLDKLNLQFSTM